MTWSFTLNNLILEICQIIILYLLDLCCSLNSNILSAFPVDIALPALFSQPLLENEAPGSSRLLPR